MMQRNLHLALSGFALACVLSASNVWADADADLLSAADSGKIAGVRAALAKHANINALDEFGNTALITAVGNADIALIKLLIARGADLQIKNNEGDTALTLAGHQSVVGADFVEFGDEQRNAMIRVLLAGGAKVTREIVNAADQGNLELVKLLLAHHADINARSPNGMTALHCAVDRGYVEVVAFLLKQGADATLRNDAGDTPMDLTAAFLSDPAHPRHENMKKIVNLLQQALNK
jgi:ankyrin repeat protein